MSLGVFLVEDNAVIRATLTATLEELAPVRVIGFASDEGSAIDWIVSNAGCFDLLLIDVFLREGSGLGVLRAIGPCRGVNAVVLTNYATDEMRRRCIELGACRVFDKSSEIEALIEYCSQIKQRVGVSPGR